MTVSGGREQGGGPGDAPSSPGPPPCEHCGGTGWLTYEDPICGGLVDARCPDCEDTDR